MIVFALVWCFWSMRSLFLLLCWLFHQTSFFRRILFLSEPRNGLFWHREFRERIIFFRGITKTIPRLNLRIFFRTEFWWQTYPTPPPPASPHHPLFLPFCTRNQKWNIRFHYSCCPTNKYWSHFQPYALSVHYNLKRRSLEVSWNRAIANYNLIARITGIVYMHVIPVKWSHILCLANS